MKLRIENPLALQALRHYLAKRKDFIVQEREPGTIAVGVLGSLRDGGRIELEGYLRPWRDRHVDIAIEVVPDV